MSGNAANEQVYGGPTGTMAMGSCSPLGEEKMHCCYSQFSPWNIRLVRHPFVAVLAA